MKTLSHEHLEQLSEQLQLTNMAYNELRRTWAMSVKELGLDACQDTINRLLLDRNVLRLKIDALHKFLTQ